MAYAENQVTIEIVNDGFSPIVEVDQSDNAATITVTDVTGTKTDVVRKRQVFVTEPTTPYSVGDLWVTAGGDQEIVESLITDEGDFIIDSAEQFFEVLTKGVAVYVCMTSRPSGAFNESDWSLAATDNTSVNELREWFWHDATGAHVLGDATGFRNDIDSTGMHIRDTADEETVAEFAVDGATIGRYSELRVVNSKDNNERELHERFVTIRDNARLGTYEHKLRCEYLGGLKLYIAFTAPNSGAIPNSWTKTIDLEDFGEWEIDAQLPLFSASGTVSFNATTSTITLTVTSISDQSVNLVIADAIYTTYPRYAAIGIGETADLFDRNIAFAIGGGLEQGNVFDVDRYGNVNRNGNPLADMVTELGGSNQWSWRKWESGKIEAWFEGVVQSSVGATEVTAPIYRGTWSLSIPSQIGFASAPHILITNNYEPTNVISINGKATSATAISGNFFRVDNQQSTVTLYTRIYAWGVAS